MRLALLLVAALGLSACGVANASHAPTVRGKVGLAARAVDGFYDLEGKPASLASLAGKAIVLSFLTPGQADCEAQLPHLIRLSDAYAADNIRFVLAGERTTPAALQRYATDNGLVFPVWEDRGGAEFFKRGFTKLPAFEFRSAKGEVLSSREGFMSRGELLEQLEALKSLD